MAFSRVLLDQPDISTKLKMEDNNDLNCSCARCEKCSTMINSCKQGVNYRDQKIEQLQDTVSNLKNKCNQFAALAAAREKEIAFLKEQMHSMVNKVKVLSETLCKEVDTVNNRPVVEVLLPPPPAYSAPSASAEHRPSVLASFDDTCTSFSISHETQDSFLTSDHAFSVSGSKEVNTGTSTSDNCKLQNNFSLNKSSSQGENSVNSLIDSGLDPKGILHESKSDKTKELNSISQFGGLAQVLEIDAYSKNNSNKLSNNAGTGECQEIQPSEDASVCTSSTLPAKQLEVLSDLIPIKCADDQVKSRIVSPVANDLKSSVHITTDTASSAKDTTTMHDVPHLISNDADCPKNEKGVMEKPVSPSIATSDTSPALNLQMDMDSNSSDKLDTRMCKTVIETKRHPGSVHELSGQSKEHSHDRAPMDCSVKLYDMGKASVVNEQIEKIVPDKRRVQPTFLSAIDTKRSTSEKRIENNHKSSKTLHKPKIENNDNHQTDEISIHENKTTESLSRYTPKGDVRKSKQVKKKIKFPSENKQLCSGSDKHEVPSKVETPHKVVDGKSIDDSKNPHMAVIYNKNEAAKLETSSSICLTKEISKESQSKGKNESSSKVHVNVQNETLEHSQTVEKSSSKHRDANVQKSQRYKQEKKTSGSPMHQGNKKSVLEELWDEYDKDKRKKSDHIEDFKCQERKSPLRRSRRTSHLHKSSSPAPNNHSISDKKLPEEDSIKPHASDNTTDVETTNELEVTSTKSKRFQIPKKKNVEHDTPERKAISKAKNIDTSGVEKSTENLLDKFSFPTENIKASKSKESSIEINDNACKKPSYIESNISKTMDKNGSDDQEYCRLKNGANKEQCQKEPSKYDQHCKSVPLMKSSRQTSSNTSGDSQPKKEITISEKDSNVSFVSIDFHKKQSKSQGVYKTKKEIPKNVGPVKTINDKDRLLGYCHLTNERKVEQAINNKTQKKVQHRLIEERPIKLIPEQEEYVHRTKRKRTESDDSDNEAEQSNVQENISLNLYQRRILMKSDKQSHKELLKKADSQMLKKNKADLKAPIEIANAENNELTTKINNAILTDGNKGTVTVTETLEIELSPESNLKVQNKENVDQKQSYTDASTSLRSDSPLLRCKDKMAVKPRSSSTPIVKSSDSKKETLPEQEKHSVTASTIMGLLKSSTTPVTSEIQRSVTDVLDAQVKLSALKDANATPKVPSILDLPQIKPTENLKSTLVSTQFDTHKSASVLSPLNAMVTTKASSGPPLQLIPLNAAQPTSEEVTKSKAFKVPCLLPNDPRMKFMRTTMTEHGNVSDGNKSESTKNKEFKVPLFTANDPRKNRKNLTGAEQKCNVKLEIPTSHVISSLPKALACKELPPLPGPMDLFTKVKDKTENDSKQSSLRSEISKDLQKPEFNVKRPFDHTRGNSSPRVAESDLESLASNSPHWVIDTDSEVETAVKFNVVALHTPRNITMEGRKTMEKVDIPMCTNSNPSVDKQMSSLVDVSSPCSNNTEDSSLWEVAVSTNRKHSIETEESSNIGLYDAMYENTVNEDLVENSLEMAIVKQGDSQVEKARDDSTETGITEKADVECDKLKFEMGIMKQGDSQVEKAFDDSTETGVTEKADVECDKLKLERDIATQETMQTKNIESAETNEVILVSSGVTECNSQSSEAKVVIQENFYNDLETVGESCVVTVLKSDKKDSIVECSEMLKEKDEIENVKNEAENAEMDYSLNNESVVNKKENAIVVKSITEDIPSNKVVELEKLSSEKVKVIDSDEKNEDHSDGSSSSSSSGDSSSDSSDSESSSSSSSGSGSSSDSETDDDTDNTDKKNVDEKIEVKSPHKESSSGKTVLTSPIKEKHVEFPIKENAPVKATPTKSPMKMTPSKKSPNTPKKSPYKSSYRVETPIKYNSPSTLFEPSPAKYKSPLKNFKALLNSNELEATNYSPGTLARMRKEMDKQEKLKDGSSEKSTLATKVEVVDCVFQGRCLIPSSENQDPLADGDTLGEINVLPDSRNSEDPIENIGAAAPGCNVNSETVTCNMDINKVFTTSPTQTSETKTLDPITIFESGVQIQRDMKKEEKENKTFFKLDNVVEQSKGLHNIDGKGPEKIDCKFSESLGLALSSSDESSDDESDRQHKHDSSSSTEGSSSGSASSSSSDEESDSGKDNEKSSSNERDPGSTKNSNPDDEKSTMNDKTPGMLINTGTNDESSSDSSSEDADDDVIVKEEKCLEKDFNMKSNKNTTTSNENVLAEANKCSDKKMANCESTDTTSEEDSAEETNSKRVLAAMVDKKIHSKSDSFSTENIVEQTNSNSSHVPIFNSKKTEDICKKTSKKNDGYDEKEDVTCKDSKTEMSTTVINVTKKSTHIELKKDISSKMIIEELDDQDKLLHQNNYINSKAKRDKRDHNNSKEINSEKEDDHSINIVKNSKPREDIEEGEIDSSNDSSDDSEGKEDPNGETEIPNDTNEHAKNEEVLVKKSNEKADDSEEEGECEESEAEEYFDLTEALFVPEDSLFTSPLSPQENPKRLKSKMKMDVKKSVSSDAKRQRKRGSLKDGRSTNQSQTDIKTVSSESNGTEDLRNLLRKKEKKRQEQKYISNVHSHKDNSKRQCTKKKRELPVFSPQSHSEKRTDHKVVTPQSRRKDERRLSSAKKDTNRIPRSIEKGGLDKSDRHYTSISSKRDKEVVSLRTRSSTEKEESFTRAKKQYTPSTARSIRIEGKDRSEKKQRETSSITESRRDSTAKTHSPHFKGKGNFNVSVEHKLSPRKSINFQQRSSPESNSKFNKKSKKDDIRRSLPTKGLLKFSPELQHDKTSTRKKSRLSDTLRYEQRNESKAVVCKSELSSTSERKRKLSSSEQKLSSAKKM